jgi:hypothetical protein
VYAVILSVKELFTNRSIMLQLCTNEMSAQLGIVVSAFVS